MAASETRYIIGTSGWNYRDWRGDFYPKDVPQRRWLEYYAEQFPAVELNATFYRLFPDSTYDKWFQRVPEGFEYVLKMPRRISHRKHLDQGFDTLDTFLTSTQRLHPKTGPLLLQLGPSVAVEPDALDQLLSRATQQLRVAVEFRDSQSWMTDKVLEVLKKHDVALVDVDSPRDRFHGRITGSFGYLRLHGVKEWFSHDYSEKELEEAADHIKTHYAGKVDRVYIFFNNTEGGAAPQNAKDLARLLDQGV